MIEFIIDKDGKPAYAKVLKGGNDELNDKLQEKFENMPTWKPATRLEKTVAIKLKQSIENNTIDYIISIAFAKKVHMNGRERVSSSPLNSHSKKKEITDKKKRTQYKPVDFSVVAMFKIYAKIIQKPTFTHL